MESLQGFRDLRMEGEIRERRNSGRGAEKKEETEMGLKTQDGVTTREDSSL